MNVRKQFGVVYTPDWTVSMMLDKLPTLKDIALCDPACGDGQFLAEVVERACKAIQRSRSKASQEAYYATLRKLTGMDIDSNALRQCRARLNAILSQYGCRKIDWELHEIDAMDRWAWINFFGSFDAVVGNPPYVRIQHLEASRRKRIASGGWLLMAGCSDLFILFYELGLELLKPRGRLVFITPSSWMKSQSGKFLRQCLRMGHSVASITDFGEHQVFADPTTYTAITEIHKGIVGGETAKAQKCIGFKRGLPVLVSGQVDLRGNNWSVLTASDARFISRIHRKSSRCLGDVAEIRVGIQTLADSVFIVGAGSLDIEKGVIRRVIKASVMQQGKDKKERVVIYPYDKCGRLIPEHELADRYPKAYNYLLSNKKKLLARDKGATDPDRWYGFGREVSIVSGFGDKILTAALNPAPNFQRCPDPNALFYSGYSITPKSGVSMDALLQELNSEEMDRYIKLVSKPYRNGWYSYAKSFIQSFPVSRELHV